MRSSTTTDIAPRAAAGSYLVRTPRLEQLKSQLDKLDQPASHGPFRSSDLIDTQRAWENWTTVQRREVIRLLFDELSIKHGSHTRPRADLSRLQVEWAHA